MREYIMLLNIINLEIVDLLKKKKYKLVKKALAT